VTFIAGVLTGFVGALLLAGIAIALGMRLIDDSWDKIERKEGGGGGGQRSDIDT
jgi:hypothetical protein